MNAQEPILAAEEISVSFGGVRAVDSVSMSVRPDEIVGLIGPNGSGKTSFLNALTGVVAAAGSLTVTGRSVALGSPERSRRAGLLRMFQTPQPFSELTCVENVLLSAVQRRGSGIVGSWLWRPGMWSAERSRMAVAVEALERVGLGDRALDTAAMLTYGEQRLLDLARGIAGNPRVLMLDEPSAGLNDAETRALGGLLRGIRDDGIALLVIDHKIDFIDSICDTIVVLELGSVIARGAPAGVWKDQRVMDAYLGVG